MTLRVSGIAAVAAALICASQAAGLEWRLRVGSDVIGQRFRVIDTDTTDIATEFRAQLQTLWEHSGSSWRRVTLDHRIGAGTLSLRDDVRAEAKLELSPIWAAIMRSSGAARYYFDDAGGARSDFAEGRAEVSIQRNVGGEAFRLGIDQGVEGLAYRKRSTVFRNGIRHWHGLSFDGRSVFDFYGGRLVFEREYVPDSTQIGYVGLNGDLFGIWNAADELSISADAVYFVRRYEDKWTRPHQVDVIGQIRTSWRLGSRWSLDVVTAGSSAWHSQTNDAFYDVKTVEPAIEAIYWPDWGSARIGPAAAFQQSASFWGDGYSQWSALGGANVFSSAWGLFDLTAEVGRRDYSEDGEALFSDYTFWDVALLSSANLYWDIRMEAFLTLRSEYHADAENSVSSIVLTVDMSRSIRD